MFPLKLFVLCSLLLTQIIALPLENSTDNTIVGYTKVNLEGRPEKCGKGECNLGNLITDAMIFARVLENKGGEFWSDAPIAVFPGGGIQSSLDRRADGSITNADISAILAANPALFVTTVSGKTLRTALEHSAQQRNTGTGAGFLQVAGAHVVYDFNHKSGEQVTNVELRCGACVAPVYENVSNDKMYKLIVPETLLNDQTDYGYVLKESNGAQPERLQKSAQEALTQFIAQRGFVYPEVEERINIVEKGKDDGAMSLVSSLFGVLVTLIISQLLK